MTDNGHAISSNIPAFVKNNFNRETLVGAAVVVVAIAAIAGGAVLLGIGGHGLAPHHIICRYGNKKLFILGSTQNKLQSVIMLGGGAASVALGVYLIGKTLLHVGRKKSDAIARFDKALSDHRLWKLFKLACAVTAFVGGLVLVGFGAAYILYTHPVHFFHSINNFQMQGSRVWQGPLSGWITGIAGGSALVTLSVCMIVNEFLKKQTVLQQLIQPNANFSDDL